MATRRNEYTFRGGDIIEREEYHDGKYGAKGKKREKKKTPTREDMKKVNAMNKAKKARHKMLTYFGPGDILATWGYLVKNRPGSMKEALDDFKKAIRTVRREYKKRGYELFWIRNIEKGTRGAWHIHIIVNEIGDTASILEKAWQKGGTWACAIKKSQYYDDDFTELGNYITKDENTQKEKEDGTLAKPRIKEASYNTSRNMPLPKPHTGKIGQTLSDGIKGFFEFAISAIEHMDWWSMGDTIYNKAKDLMVNIDWSGIADRVFETIGAAFGGFAAFIGGIFKNAVADARKYIIKHFTEAGKFTWEGFKNGVVQSFKDIGTWIKAHIFKPFINGFKKAFGIHSPSTVMRTQGGYVISGLFNGMKAGLPAVLSWIAKLPGQVKERLGNAKTWLRGKGNAAITGLKNGWEAVRESTFLSRVKKIGSQSFNAIGDIKSKVTPKGRDIISGMRTGLNNNWSSLSGILSNIPGKVANAIPSLYTVGQNVIQTFANGFSSIHIPMPHIGWDWEGGSIKIGNFKFSLPRFNLSWYANGGFPGMGEMFVARESGPELVGRMGKRSAVANNNQIIAGIRAGVFEAVVNAFESMQGRNDRGQELHIYLEGDAKKLFKGIRQEGTTYQKQTGNPVFG